MYPSWVKQLFQRFHCNKCGRKLTTNDIESVGIQRKSTNDPYHKFPQATITIPCPTCGRCFRFTEWHDIDHIIAAIRAHHARLNNPQDHSTGSCAGTRLAEPERTSEPISETEAKRFINRLKRTSFKRRSKSFRAWMSDLGIDIDEGTAKHGEDIPF